VQRADSIDLPTTCTHPSRKASVRLCDGSVPLVASETAIGGFDADFASSAIVAFVAVACLDYFFVPPLFSFNVTDPYNILALCSFLITALVITRFATKAREEARASAHRHERLKTLYKLSQQLLAMEPELR
jgi:K+-sensing histidine kinase KdpD